MLTKDEAIARVARGAAHLDQVRPGWFRQIDVGTLDLGRGCRCIVGQLTAGWFSRRLGIASPFPADGMPSVLELGMLAGVVGPEAQPTYALLQDAWVQAIADRLHPVETAHPIAVAVAS